MKTFPDPIPTQGPLGVPLVFTRNPALDFIFFGISRLVRWLAPEDRREGWKAVTRWVYCLGMEQKKSVTRLLIPFLVFYLPVSLAFSQSARQTCGLAHEKRFSDPLVAIKLLDEIKAQGINCIKDFGYQFEWAQEQRICDIATTNFFGQKRWEISSQVYQIRVVGAKARQLDCGVIEGSKNIKPPSDDSHFANSTDQEVCRSAVLKGDWDERPLFLGWVREARRRGLDCGVGKAWPSVAQTKPSERSDEAAEKIRLLEQRLAKIEAEKKAAQQAISQDAQPPSIRITSTNSDGARGTISGTITDNTGIAEVLVDGQAVAVDTRGRFTTSTFNPSTGNDEQITAYDLKGLSTTETVRLERSKRTQAVSRLAAVNPLVGPKQKTSRERVALIIGVEKYASAPSADFASRDAQMFADYAREKLGIPAGNVKVLTDSGAGERNILEALRIWLPQAVKPDTTDLYVFYAGHGMPTADGSSAYLVPYDGDVRFLEDTAISRKRFFDEIGAARPRSATFFFDNCYSGATRSEELLLASRPLGIKVQETDVPENYLVFTAGESNQTAGVLEEVKHGRFSYFVFKGLEGEADANSDGKISAGELHAYVRESVGRFSAGAQTPTMLGDGNRWVLR